MNEPFQLVGQDDNDVVITLGQGDSAPEETTPEEPAVVSADSETEEGTEQALTAEESDTPAKPDKDLFADEEDSDEPEGNELLDKNPGLKKRLDRLVEMKNEAKTRADEEQALRLQAEERYQKVVETHGAFLETYNRFESPAAQLVADSQFMDAVQQFKDTPQVRAAIDFIDQYLKHGNTEGKTMNQPTNTDTPTVDPRFERILRQQVDAQVKDILEANQAPAQYRRAIHNFVQDAVDLSDDVTEQDVTELIKTFIKDNGWTDDFKAARKTSKKAQPPAMTPKAAAPASPKAKGGSQGEPAKRESRDLDSVSESLREQLVAKVVAATKSR